jgi:protein-tyrosine phosphatase
MTSRAARLGDRFFMQQSAAKSWTAALRKYLKVLYHAMRNLPDRLLHPKRHAAALRHLGTMRRPRRILVLCHGNICRSPYLEAMLQRALPDISISSAGFVGADRPVPQFSLDVSARRGLDLSRFRSRPIFEDDVSNSNLIIVMDARQARQLRTLFLVEAERIVIAGDLDPRSSSNRAIQDPWKQTVGVFESSFARLDRCAETLVTLFAKSSEPSGDRS